MNVFNHEKYLKNKTCGFVFLMILLFGGTIHSFAFYEFSNTEKSVQAKRISKSKSRLIIHRNSGKVRRAVCRDGSISLSKNRRGTCSHHGGVARWLR